VSAQTRWSRYANGLATTDDEGRIYMVRRVPARFIARSDNKSYTVTSGDTIFGIAGRMYRESFPIPGEQLAWMVAEFQPKPITDLTLRLEEGQIIYGPSESYARLNIFVADRRDRVE